MTRRLSIVDLEVAEVYITHEKKGAVTCSIYNYRSVSQH